MLSRLLARVLRGGTSAATPAEDTARHRDGPSEDSVRRILAKPNTAPDLFGVVSWGCAATTWLGQALNSVPDVLCLHNVRLYLRQFAGVSFADDELHYLTGLRRLGVCYKLVGEIHGITLGHVARLREAMGDRFHAAAVVRAPGPRLLSQLRLFEDGGYAGWEGLEYVRTLPGFAGVARHVTDARRVCFVHAANMLNAIVDESRLCRVFRCEDLTASPGAFREFVAHLSGGRVEVPDALTEQIVNRPRVGAHGRGGAALAIDQDWQVEILRAVVRPESMALYAGLGYETPEWWAGGAAARAA